MGDPAGECAFGVDAEDGSGACEYDPSDVTSIFTRISLAINAVWDPLRAQGSSLLARVASLDTSAMLERLCSTVKGSVWFRLAAIMTVCAVLIVAIATLIKRRRRRPRPTLVYNMSNVLLSSDAGNTPLHELLSSPPSTLRAREVAEEVQWVRNSSGLDQRGRYREDRWLSGDKNNPRGEISMEWIHPEQMAPNDAFKSLKTDPILLIYASPVAVSVDAYEAMISGLRKKDIAYRVAIFFGRGDPPGVSCTGPVKNQVPFSPGNSADFKEIVEKVHGEYPLSPIVAAGFGLGGNAIVKYIGQEGKDCLLHAAACFACPFDLASAARSLSREGLNKNSAIAKVAASQAAAMEGVLANTNGDVIVAEKLKTWSERVAEAHGFKTVGDYYRDGSCVNWLTKVKRPLLCVGAADDGACEPKDVPFDEFRANRHTILVYTDTGGGGMGWLDSAGRSWAVEAARAFFEASLLEIADVEPASRRHERQLLSMLRPSRGGPGKPHQSKDGKHAASAPASGQASPLLAELLHGMGIDTGAATAGVQGMPLGGEVAADTPSTATVQDEKNPQIRPSSSAAPALDGTNVSEMLSKLPPDQLRSLSAFLAHSGGGKVLGQGTGPLAGIAARMMAMYGGGGAQSPKK